MHGHARSEPDPEWLWFFEGEIYRGPAQLNIINNQPLGFC